jgi:hypothetical protein
VLACVMALVVVAMAGSGLSPASVLRSFSAAYSLAIDGEQDGDQPSASD